MSDANHTPPNMVDPKLAQWREEGRHLPQCLRDFHDAKRLFKTMHTVMPSANCTDPVHSDKANFDWVQGQIYTIDKFLWFMARHGYTLQRSRTKLNFDDLEQKIRGLEERQSQQFAELLKQATKSKETESLGTEKSDSEERR